VLNLKTGVLDYVLKMKGVIKEPLINLINEQIYGFGFDKFEQGGIVSKDIKKSINTELRSVKILSLYEEQVGNSVSNRIIFNELKKGVALIEHSYKQKVSPHYFSKDNYFQFLYYNDEMQGHYDFHTDYCKEHPRQLTILIGLNSKEEYVGGELFVQNYEEGIVLGKGDVVCFPSNFMYPHKVGKVTKGERKVLVIWTQ